VAGDYYVRFIDETPQIVYGPYSLSSAKSFARIGSSFGGRREVTHGENGPIIRVYERGYRVRPESTGKPNPSWSRKNSKTLIQDVAEVIWGRVLREAIEVGVHAGLAPTARTELSFPVPNSAKLDAQRYLTSFKKLKGSPWWEFANKYHISDLDDFSVHVVREVEQSGADFPMRARKTARVKVTRLAKSLG
jgi:hypothetical protein